MAIIKAVNFNNIRSLTDENYVELKPLTILVGKNSVGKSTFARTFPLIKQSCEAKKKSPILWYGKYVDFGDYETAINKYKTEDGIKLGFEIKLGGSDIVNIFDTNYASIAQLGHDFLRKITKINDTNLNVEFTFKKNNDESYSYDIDLSILEKKIKILLNKDTIDVKINNLEYNLNKDKKYTFTQNKIFPSLSLNIETEKKLFKYGFNYFHYQNHIFVELLDDYFKKNRSKKSLLPKDQNEKMEYYSHILSHLIIKNFIKVDQTISKNISDSVLDINIINKIGITEIENLFWVSKVSKLLEFIDDLISDYFLKVQYLEPLRATAQRYYRKQEYAIDEVDSKGSNIGMFMLEHHNQTKLKKLIKSHFNLEFIAEQENSHITLKLLLENSDKINLADLGVGYSQLLPVILQLWNSAYNSENITNKCVVIEQPELHLHPAYQAKIADITIEIINDLKAQKKRQAFIFETHSQNLINRLGELIEEGKLNHNDVQILIFDNDLNSTKITHSKFNEEGILENWPFGFFN